VTEKFEKEEGENVRRFRSQELGLLRKIPNPIPCRRRECFLSAAAGTLLVAGGAAGGRKGRQADTGRSYEARVWSQVASPSRQAVGRRRWPWRGALVGKRRHPVGRWVRRALGLGATSSVSSRSTEASARELLVPGGGGLGELLVHDVLSELLVQGGTRHVMVHY
jgi:hypothetical protein